jgi:quinol monooxygenase YgiN
MIVVIAEIRVTEGAVDTVRDAIAKMESESRKEPGCHTYAFSVDISDPTLVRIIERWESMDDLKAHFGTPHMAEFNGAIGALGIQSMQVNAYELGEEKPLPI